MTVLSNWSTLVEGLSTSVQESYSELEQALEVREVPELEISRVGRALAKTYKRSARKEPQPV